MIAVTGATGELGGRVARRLADRDVEQRLLVRDPSRAPRVPHSEVRQIAGYGDGESMRAALAGVERLVYLSFVGAAPDATFTLVRHHWATEERIRETGIPFTFVRMNLYMDFLPAMTGEDGVIRGPAGAGR